MANEGVQIKWWEIDSGELSVMVKLVRNENYRILAPADIQKINNLKKIANKTKTYDMEEKPSSRFMWTI